MAEVSTKHYSHFENFFVNINSSTHGSFHGLLFGIDNVASISVLYHRLLQHSTLRGYPAFRQSLEAELKWFEGFVTSSQLLNRSGSDLEIRRFLPQHQYLKVTEYDRGHGLNNIRTMYALALMYGRATHRIVVLPDVIMAFCHLLPTLNREMQPLELTFINITELFDIDAMNAVDPSHYRVKLQSQLPELMRNASFGHLAWDTVNIFGTSFRPWKTWTDTRTINFIAKYPGVLLTTPYFFCDAYDKKTESYRLEANSVFRWSPWLNRTITNIYRSIRQTYHHQKIVSIHMRFEPIYGVIARAYIDRLTAIADYLRAHGYDHRKCILFLAGGNINEQMITVLRSHHHYTIVRKEQFLPRDWEPPLWSKYLSMKASAIDFELCVLSDLFVGTSESSFSMLVAAQRKMSHKIQLSYDYANRSEMCLHNKPCFYYC
ncbi:unnamed protein product [Didymodactylos carnosus]|uniref:O-fucosyltransferase family protein n=1 Tax=Didymodactylos carnosus TaxID=1234261 RepID=A0A815Y249_9BILA|nr:unnamed protein product [Didymodactylos carnosus]CAF4426710.1 unnamed protein product [Didymodactylos carnosus]